MTPAEQRQMDADNARIGLGPGCEFVTLNGRMVITKRSSELPEEPNGNLLHVHAPACPAPPAGDIHG